ncbi:MAG: Uma2 family endonuclease [Flavisolibacter sp.]|nr:Uma2 family endonuclease [Flavisolibacter sp.]
MGISPFIYQRPPRTGLEAYELLPEGTLAELINDKIFMSPAPTYSHQDTSAELVLQIRNYVKQNALGVCITAPIDVFFDEKNVLQPDIVFTAQENLSIIKDDKIKGVPDLIIEILSPGNPDLDKVVKKEVYEQFGVKEYFIVHPVTKEVIAYQHDGQQYILQQSEYGRITSKILNNYFGF